MHHLFAEARSHGGRRIALLVAALLLALLALPATYDSARAANTGTIAVCLTDSTGANLVLGGDQAWIQVNGGSILYVGPVGASGCRETLVTNGNTAKVWVARKGTTSQPIEVPVPNGGTTRVDFYTTKVTLQYSQDLAFGGPAGDRAYFSKPSEELLSDGVTPINFRLDGTGGAAGRMSLLWPIATGPGAQFTRSLVAVRLVDHTNQPLAGGIASVYSSGWAFSVATTGANGIAAFAIPDGLPGPALATNVSVALTYNGTLQQLNQFHPTDSVFNFKTVGVVVELKDSSGNPLDGGQVSYFAGGWHSVGATAGGEVLVEMLPGSYAFAMRYNHSYQQKNAVNVVSTNPVVFQTGSLKIVYSGAAQWYHEGWWSFGPGSQELLPGTVNAYLDGCLTPVAITSGAKLTTSGVLARLRNSANQPLAGGEATVYAGGWKPVGTTDSTGRACTLLNGTLANTSVRMVYNGSSQQLTQNQPTSSVYVFTAGGITVELRDSDGNLMDTGNASYYAGGWHTIGDTSGGKVTVALLPGSYAFAMTYNGTREQKNAVPVTANSVVVFQTVGVTVELRDSENTLLDTGNASYYAGGWRTIGNTSGGQAEVEMLPGSYAFAMTYNGTREQKNGVNITSTNPVVFQTVGVTVELRDSGNALLDTGNASYYAGGWRTIGDTSGGQAEVEMLPGSYAFAMTYNGTREQKNGVNIASTNPVVFQTVGVTVELRDSASALLDTGNASYYAGGWRTIGDTSGGQAEVEMLPGSYAFAMTYNGTREQKNGVNIASTNPVVFQTGKVISDSGTATGYYAGGWRTFASGGELLPGSYTFRWSDSTPNGARTVVAATENHIH